MFTIMVPMDSPISQQYYDDALQKIHISALTCSCGNHGSFVYHGSYRRKLITENGKLPLSITRIKCKNCRHTHALLLSSMVPYTQIPLYIQTKIICCCELYLGIEKALEKNIFLEKSTAYALIGRYRDSWREWTKGHVSLLSKHSQMEGHNKDVSVFNTIIGSIQDAKNSTATQLLKSLLISFSGISNLSFISRGCQFMQNRTAWNSNYLIST